MSAENEIKEALTKYKRIAVVGLSPDPSKPSYDVSEYMQSHGYKIIPVRPPGGETILGEKSVGSLAEVPQPVGIVDVFRRPEFVPEVVDAAIAAGAKVLWLQLGITHPAAEEKARRAGLLVISDKCILVEHRRLVR